MLTHDDIVRGLVMASLSADFFIDIAMVEAACGIDFRRYFRAEWNALRDFEGMGALSIHAAHLALTAQGRLVCDDARRVFDQRARMLTEAYERPHVDVSRSISVSPVSDSSKPPGAARSQRRELPASASGTRRTPGRTDPSSELEAVGSVPGAVGALLEEGDSVDGETEREPGPSSLLGLLDEVIDALARADLGDRQCGTGSAKRPRTAETAGTGRTSRVATR